MLADVEPLSTTYKYPPTDKTLLRAPKYKTPQDPDKRCRSSTEIGMNVGNVVEVIDPENQWYRLPTPRHTLAKCGLEGSPNQSLNR